MLNLCDIRRILDAQSENEPADDFRIVDSWVEYESSAGKSSADFPLKYMCYELEMINPETNEIIKMYKALKFVRVFRLPKSAKTSNNLMENHHQVLSACYNNRINLVTLVANIIKPRPVGLLFLYGVQGVATDIEKAKLQADKDMLAFRSSMQATFPVLELRKVRSEEAEWLRNKMLSMTNLTVVKGIPRVNENNSSKKPQQNYSSGSVNPSSQTSDTRTLEELIIGLADIEYVLEIITTPAFQRTLEALSLANERNMTDWYEQLQGTKGMSFNLSMPMMSMVNQNSSQGWSENYTDASSVNYSDGTSYGTSFSESVSESLSESFGQGFSQNVGSSVSQNIGSSVNQSFGTSVNQSFGTSVNISEGSSVNQNVGESLSESFGTSISESLGASVSENVGQSITESNSTSLSQGHSTSHSSSIGTSESVTESLSQSLSETLSHSSSESHSTSLNEGYSFNSGTNSSVQSSTNYGFNIGDSLSNSYNFNGSLSQNYNATQSFQNSLSEAFGLSESQAESLAEQISESLSNGESNASGFNVGGNIFGFSGGYNGSGSNSSSNSQTQGNTITISDNFGRTHTVNLSDAFSVSQGSGYGNSSSEGGSSGHTTTFGQNFSQSAGSSFGYSQSEGFNYGSSESFGYTSGSSYGTSHGTSQSLGHSSGTSASVSEGWGESLNIGQTSGTSIGQTQSQGVSQNMSQSQGQTSNMGQTLSSSQGASQSVSQGSSQSVSQGSSQSISQGTSQSVSQGTSQSVSQGVSQNKSESIGTTSGSSNGVNQGVSSSVSKGSSQSSSVGTTGAYSAGMSGSLGLAPAISFQKSHQWLNQQVKDILEILEFKNERYKKALRVGAFHTYVYLATQSEKTLAAAKTVAVSTWQNDFALSEPIQALNLTNYEQKHLLYHFNAFSADYTRTELYGESVRKYGTLLLSDELTAFSHLPRVSEGGIYADVEDIPKFAVTALRKGDVFMGSIITSEKYSFENGYTTPHDYRFPNDCLAHGYVTGASRSGKTICAIRLVAELSRIRRDSGKRLRIFALDPKKDWRVLARFVEPERFNFYSLGDIYFHPISLNLLKVPKGVYPDRWINSVVDIFCRAYGLAVRGKLMVTEPINALFEQHGVFDAFYNTKDKEERSRLVSELSGNITFCDVYKEMEKNQKLALADKSMGNDTKDAYSKLLDRLKCFDRPNSVETKLFGQRTGRSVDEIAYGDSVTVIESGGLEKTFANFVFGVITSGFFQYAKASSEIGLRGKDENETLIVLEEANEVLTGNDTAGATSSSNNTVGVSGQSEFEQIINESMGLGVYILSITQTLSSMPSTVVSNAGMMFVGRISAEKDVNTALKSLGKEYRYEDRDIAKWLPRSPEGWFICKTARVKNFIDAEPVLIKVAMLNALPPTDEELDTILVEHKISGILEKSS